ncbi:MAG TPA: polysaccharide lyase family protein [Armatimonadota bacterium]|nr:polysaccharide lyase family protein [Armatimonadota bacterium]
MSPRRRSIFLFLASLLLMAPQAGFAVNPAPTAPGRREWKFDFGPGKAARGYIPVTPTSLYAPTPLRDGFGFAAGGLVIHGVDRGGPDRLRASFCTADKPFFFNVDLPEGNYTVSVTLGDRNGGSTTTVKAEARRLMLENIQTEPGRFTTRSFTVNVHNSRLKSGGSVLKQGGLDWDDRLTLEFSGAHPCVDAVTIAPALPATDPADPTPTLPASGEGASIPPPARGLRGVPAVTPTLPASREGASIPPPARGLRGVPAVTVFIAGDSTVCDQPIEPWAAWGQMLPRFFGPGAAVANYAESGLTLRTFRSTGRLEKVMEMIKPGDYLLIQFGHNDQKEKGPGVGAFTTYKADLVRFITEARAHGAHPVLVTPMNRRFFDAAGRVINTLGDYPAAVRQTAAEEKVPLIDLNAMSKTFYEAMGPEGSKKAFVQYPAGTFPGQGKALKDNTHFNDYGAYELAKLIVNGIRTAAPALAGYLQPVLPPFDPAHPDPVENWSLPLDTPISTTTPASMAEPAVTLSQDADSFTMDNGIVRAKVNKRSGDLVSLRYRGLEILGAGSGHPYGYWEHTPGRDSRLVDSVTIDPLKNGGDRAEVSVKGYYQGTALGEGPGGATDCDIEIRYSLGRGDSGVYAYSIFDHPANYPATSVGEGRFCAKLNDSIFDYMTIDANRRKEMITAYDWDHGVRLNMKEARRMTTGIYKGQVEHKYDYSAVQFDTPAYGWSSTRRHVGVWFINPTIEYLSGGATKVELTAHRDTTFIIGSNGPADPTLLNYWRGSHYGGSSCVISAGEAWSKVVGPFLIYCNTGPTNDAMWNDALAQAAVEAQKWPYDWVRGVDYPHKSQLGTVSGQIILDDPGYPAEKMSHLLVGLTHPDYTEPGRGGVPVKVDWQKDAKYYQFWVRGGNDGRFSIPNVRPGVYTLHVIADGVLGEYTRLKITVAPGQALDLGHIQWKPVRYGRQLWEIGIPDRTAKEFLHGDHYWQWGLYNQYDTDFPHDVNFVIGKSDMHRDWNYAQVPHANGEGTTWSVRFDLPEAQHGRATLRLALAATTAHHIDVTVNGQPAGSTGPLPDTATIRRDGIRGYWEERDVTFDASLLKKGANVLQLTIPGGNVMNGVEYDYLRLEVE